MKTPPRRRTSRCARPGEDDPKDARLLIAAPCVRTGAPLLHADADFDRLAGCTALRIYALD